MGKEDGVEEGRGSRTKKKEEFGDEGQTQNGLLRWGASPFPGERKKRGKKTGGRKKGRQVQVKKKYHVRTRRERKRRNIGKRTGRVKKYGGRPRVDTCR